MQRKKKIVKFSDFFFKYLSKFSPSVYFIVHAHSHKMQSAREKVPTLVVGSFFENI